VLKRGCNSNKPKGANFRVKGKKPRRFVIQRHEREDEPVHWDLMLESASADKSGDILETYRIGKPPEQWANEPIKAVKIFDHPFKFLTYEGSVNKGKGSVSIADTGIYRITTQGKNRLGLELAGSILKGEFVLDFVR
jgi:hypothetical protein